MRERGWLNLLWRRTSLTQRLVLLALIPTALTALLLVSLLTQRQVRTINELARSTAESIVSQTAMIAAEPMAANDRRELYRIARAVSHLPHVSRVSFDLPNGEALVDLYNPASVTHMLPLRVHKRVVDDNGGYLGTISLELSQHNALAMQKAGLRAALWWLLAALLLAGLVSWRVARWIGRPLRKLAYTVDEFGRSDREVSVTVTDDTEIGNLQRAFNATTLARHEMQREQQQRIEAATAELAHKNAELESANVAKARFLAAATHDLRQPLYALTLISSSLTMDETDPSRLERIARIQECTNSLDGLFSELLDLSRLETGGMQPNRETFNLDDIFKRISDSFRMIAERNDLRLSVRKTDLAVCTDPTMLTRILSNLVSNALNYTEHGGVLVGARRRGGFARIDVWDTGLGMDDSVRQHAFDEFFRADPGKQHRDHSGHGFGLGLSTVHKLAELLAAPLELKSRPERGSVFSIYVPLAGNGSRDPLPHSLDPAVQAAQALPDVAGLRVLVVDDDARIRSAITFLLAGWGCDVRTAENLEQCLLAAGEWNQPPDLVISDLRLRNGVNGIDVLRALDGHYGCSPERTAFARLLITGEARADLLPEVVAARVRVLYKPVTPEQLRAAIRQASRIDR